MLSKIEIDFFTIEIYGFSAQANQAKIEITKAIRDLKPEAKALFLEHDTTPTDLDGEAHEYIKIIYSNRRLANKLRLALEPVRVFEACFIGIFPYYDTFFPGKIRPRNKRKNRRPLNPASKKDL